MTMQALARVVAFAAAVLVVAVAVPAAAQEPLPQATTPRPPSRGVPAMVAPAMPPVDLVPAFLEKGKVYTFTLVRKELKGEVVDVDPAGWVRVNVLTDDDDFDGIPWLNLNHVTLIRPEKPSVKPAKN